MNSIESAVPESRLNVHSVKNVNIPPEAFRILINALFEQSPDGGSATVYINSDREVRITWRKN